MSANILGFVGCTILCISFIPQTYSVVTSNKEIEISPYFLVLIMSTSIIMTIYGYMIRELPIIISNVSVFMNNFIITIFVMRKNRHTIDIENAQKSQEMINLNIK